MSPTSARAYRRKCVYHRRRNAAGGDISYGRRGLGNVPYRAILSCERKLRRLRKDRRRIGGECDQTFREYFRLWLKRDPLAAKRAESQAITLSALCRRVCQCGVS